ncbi:MAG: PAS domain-containing protein [Methanosarcinaceae archaeon]|nr:PAS domain-containing protein [Methanosarcinaceae archaeon]
MTSELFQNETNEARHYLDVAGFIIGVLDRNQNIIFANKKGCEVLGYSEDEIVGKNWFATFLPERIKQIAKDNYRMWMAGESEPPEYSEMPIVTRNGNERLIRWHDVILKDEEGNITGTISSGEDITLHKRTEDVLYDREMRNKAVVQLLPDTMFRLSRDGTFLDYNTPSDDLLGVQSELIIGSNIQELGFPEKVVKQFQRSIEKVLESGTLQKFEYNLNTLTAEGKFEAYIVPCAEAEVLLIICDITTHKQAEGTFLHYA